MGQLNKSNKRVSSPSRRRVSVSTPSQSQRSRRQSQSQIDVEEDDNFILIQHNERVMEMYKWLTSSHSWTEIKKTIQKWVSEESNTQDGENYMEFALDIVNLILYCGGVRVYALSDIDDLDLDALSASEKKKLIKKLGTALNIDHEEIEEIPDDVASEDDEQNSDEEKSEELNNNKKKSPKRKKKKEKARTTAEKVLCFDPMLWQNGTQAKQNSFESRYRQLMEKIGDAFDNAIFESDDWIISCILKWC